MRYSQGRAHMMPAGHPQNQYMFVLASLLTLQAQLLDDSLSPPRVRMGLIQQVCILFKEEPPFSIAHLPT